MLLQTLVATRLTLRHINTRIDMATTEKGRTLAQALSQLLSNYIAGLIPDRRWRWIMEVLDSGQLTGPERLEYVRAVNRSIASH